MKLSARDNKNLLVLIEIPYYPCYMPLWKPDHLIPKGPIHFFSLPRWSVKNSHSGITFLSLFLFIVTQILFIGFPFSAEFLFNIFFSSCTVQRPHPFYSVCFFWINYTLPMLCMNHEHYPTKFQWCLSHHICFPELGSLVLPGETDVWQSSCVFPLPCRL